MIILLSTPYSELPIEFEISTDNRIMSDDVAFDIIDNLTITKYSPRGLRILADEIDEFKMAIRNGVEIHVGNLLSYVELKDES